MASILKVDTIQDQSGNNIINENADTITIGASGDTITVPTGATLTVPNGGLSGQNYPAFKAIMASAQTITGNTLTVAQINSEVFDIGGYFNTSTYRFTPPAGKYCFIGNLGNGEFETYLTVSILKNGSEVSENTIQLNSGTWAGRSPVHAVEEANGSDYFELAVRAGSDMAILISNYRTFFSAFRLGD